MIYFVLCIVPNYVWCFSSNKILIINDQTILFLISPIRTSNHIITFCIIIDNRNILRTDETSWWKVSKKQIVKKGAKTEKIKEEEEEDFYATSSSCLSKKDIFSPSFNDLSVTLLQSRSSSRCGLVALINAIQKLWWKRRVDGGDRVGVKGRRVKNKTQSKATSFQPCSNKKI